MAIKLTIPVCENQAFSGASGTLISLPDFSCLPYASLVSYVEVTSLVVTGTGSGLAFEVPLVELDPISGMAFSIGNLASDSSPSGGPVPTTLNQRATFAIPGALYQVNWGVSTPNGWTGASGNITVNLVLSA